ncbi:MAG TPA: DUF4241 domain-containing protein [Candidatus Limnocylindria bacterium]|jgi:hypothetical protein|nr:DUF4241 domain-containing protein [Candidatus Limnocylindria bacterium]
MSIFSRFFGSRQFPPVQKDTWPNKVSWGALKDGHTVVTEDGPRFLWTVDCGKLVLPSGRLAACDPFVFLSPRSTPFIVTPKGRFPVAVTLADVSEKQDRSHVREAYASIVFSDRPEAYRKSLPLAIDGQERPEQLGDEFVGFGVDAGTACFVDESVIESCMPEPQTWHESLFDNERSDCWFRLMDDPNHIREGIANLVLPLAKNGENLILFHSGWGDGVYPVVGSFDKAGRLVAAHIDFMVL